MGAALYVPTGDNESLGIAKETIFGQYADPTVYHAFTDFSPKPKNVLLPRTGSRKRWGQSRPVTAGYEGSASLDVETDSDTLPQLLAFALGAQGTPTTAVATTLTTGAGPSAQPVMTVITPTSMTHIENSLALLIDGGLATEEMVIVSDVTATTFSAILQFAHLSGATIAAPSTAELKFGQLPSFSCTLDQIIQGVQYVGCMIDSMTISMSAKTGLSVKFNLVYQNEIVVAGGSTPTYSTKNPYIFENPFNAPVFNGVAVGGFGEVSVISWSITVANNLMKNYYSFGRGRFVNSFPQMQRKVSGTATFGFETPIAYQAFLGANNGPNPLTVPAVSMDFFCASVDQPASLNFVLPNCTLSSHEVNNKSNAVLQQTFQFESSESDNGADDDLSVILGGVVGPF